ncbi:MAG: beta-ketoacyl-[acyl-carrier-protein] synthase family protein [Flavobacteriales bacterium]|nr:beta-ketoacyl-[acyl-carrier-protein] synthase family protein [Flavobacteriales bacterium]
MSKRVVITGMGVIAPNGSGLEEFETAIRNGKSGIAFIPELAELNFACHIGGVPDTANSKYNEIIDKYGLLNGSQAIMYAGLAGLEAWENAGLIVPEYDSPQVDFDTGIMIGTGIGSIDLAGKTVIPNVDQGKISKLRSNIVEHMMISGASSQIAGILALGNLSTANSNACSTGTEAVLFGYDRIKSGKASRMVVGGTDGYSPYYWSFFDNMRILTREYNDNPELGSRPMSRTASGFVASAGAGALVLEELETAQERNATIYAEIGGGFMNSGGQRNGGSMTAPNAEGVERCIRGALDDAGVAGDDITAISGHLTSTKADLMEIRSWSSALNRSGDNFPYINSLKSMTGHCLGASGAIETIAAVLQINGGFIHPNINCDDIQEEILAVTGNIHAPNTLHDNVSVNCVAKASFGFGDVNSCIILNKYNA